MVFAMIVSLPGLAQENPKNKVPPVVNPGNASTPPSDAVVLFGGQDVNGWTDSKGKPSRCEAIQGTMVCQTGTGNQVSKEKYRNAQIHLEFAVPNMPDRNGQLRGNSGVFLQGEYELQVLDSFENPTYAHGMLGGLYSQAPPLANVARKPEEWQAYDIVFHSAKCDANGKVNRKATVTALLNGVLIHDHVEIESTKGGCEAGPLMLQDHSGFPFAPKTTMRFRNIWLRHLPN